MKRGLPFYPALCLLVLLSNAVTGFAQKQLLNDRRNFKPNLSSRNMTVITPAMRTLRTAAVTYYVNDSSVVGDQYTFAVGADTNPGTTTQPFYTIAKAIATAVPGDIIYVDAGTFREDLVVNKNNISLRGSNYLTSPNGSSRNAETVIQPATSNANYNDPNYSIVIYLDGNVNDVTIDGFTIDGDNDLITTATDSVYNGVHIDASEAISAFGQPSNIFIKNNIIKNVNYTGIDVFPQYDSPGVLAAISNNRLDNMLGDVAIGILIYNNFYADINNNVLTRQHVGIQTGNFHLPKPTAGNPSISNNSVSSNTIGIWHNLIYASAATFDILNNTLTTYNNAPNNSGLEVTSIASAVEVNINGNNVTGARVGVNLWNCPTTGTVTVRGGTLTNCKVGVFPNNFDGYPVTDPAEQAASSVYALNGITFANCDTAIWVRDNILNTNSATVALTINGVTSTVTGNGIGILIEGDGASASLSGSSPINFSTSLSRYVRYISNSAGVPSAGINAVNAQFGGATGTTKTLAELFAIEDKIDHKIDRADVGFVTVKAGNDYVTPNSFDAPATTEAKLQRGVDAASATWTMNVQAGLYADNVSVNKTLTVLGPNATINPNSGSRNAEAVVVPAVSDTIAGRVFDVNANNVIIKGFTINGDNTGLSNGSQMNGADMNAAIGIGTGVNSSRNGNSNLLVENNIFRNLDNNGGNYGAVYGYGSGAGGINGLQVLNNNVDNNSSWAVCTEYNMYGTIKGNTVTRSGRGIFMFNYWLPGTSMLIDSNNIRHYFRGMLINNHFGPFGTATISRNTITTETAGNNELGSPGARAVNYGIEVWSMFANTGTILLNDNVISNSTHGLEVWNVAPNILTQNGGTITNCTNGIYVRTNNQFGNASNNSYVSVANASISNSTANGILLADNDTPAAANIASLTLTNTFITGGVNSIRATGSDVTATINNNSFTGNSAKGIDASGYTGTTPLNATCNWYGSADNTVVASKVSGNVSYVPYLTNGTDSDPAAQGFQPVAGACGGPTELYVNDAATSGDVYTTATGNDANPGTPGAPYATISKAVAVALPGTTIYVDAGTYQEQVVIPKSLNIVGAGSSGISTTKILSPSSLSPQTSANGASRAVIFATGLPNTINIKKVLVDGAGVGNANPNFYGVHYNEASGTFDSSRITGVRNTPYDGAQDGDAFLANHEYDVNKMQVVTVSNNIMDDYQKSGIVINELHTRGIVTNNTILGQNTKKVNGQNGIQFGFGAYGTITGNTISDNLYNDSTNAFVATGILLAGVGVDAANAPTGDVIIVQNNTLVNNDAGLYSDAGGFGYNSTAGITEGPNTYTANYIHVSINTPAAVPNAANVYDKRVDNLAQTNTVFGYIQKAVDYSVAGNTLNISGHTFTEQVEVPKNLTLHGAGAGITKVVAPALLPLSYTAADVNKPVIYVRDAANVIIENLTVDGAGVGNANNRLQGIAYRNAGGTVQNSEIKDIRNTPMDGAQAGVAIFAQADNGTARTLSISGNTLTGFQKNGTVLSGADLTVTVNNNTITGAGPIDYIAQNGVQLGFDAKGTITNNTISSLSYSPGTTVAAGILIFSAGGTVTTTSNTITNAQAGIYYYGTDGLINKNTVTYTAAGMGSTPDWYAITVDDNITSVIANTINGGGKGTGIEADYFAGKNTRLTATNNFVDNIKNAFVVFTDGGGTAQVSINENSITNADTAIYNYGAINVNATCNWYGTTDNSVIAPKIIGPVTYVPYLLNGTDNDPAMAGFQAVPGSCTGPTQFFVNDTKTTNDVYTFGTGSDANPGTKEQPFRTINKALSLASTGDAIYVDGGMYPENVVVNKKVKLYGRDTAQSVATRFAAFTANKADTTLESVITAPTATPNNNPNANDLVRVQTDSVVIDGFTLDGNNSNFLTGGLTADDGTRIHARRGITNIDSADGFNPINAVSIRHNIIQNLSQRGVSLNNGGPVSVNNSIRNNLFRSFGWDQSTGGQAVILVANAYADITNNIIDVPHDQIGLHLQNFYANGSSTWSGNIVTVGQDAFGIHANLFYAPAATLNITGNTVNAASSVTGGSDFTWGINAWSVQVGSTVNILNNTVGSAGGQFARGINLWNLPTTNTVSVTGGTVARSVTGIQLDNVDPYFGGGASTTVNVSNITVAADGTNVLARAEVLPTPPFDGPNTVTGNSTINVSNATLSNATNGVIATAPAASAPYIARVQFNTPASTITGSTVPVLINGDDAQVQAGAVNITVPASGANNAIRFQNMNASSIGNLILAGGLNINLNNNAAARAFASPAGSVVELTNAWTAPTPTASGAPNSVFINGQLWFTAGILNSGGGSIEFGQTAVNIMNGPHQEKNTSYLLGQARMLPRAVGSGAIDMLGVVLPDATGENNADVGNLSIGRTTTLGTINPPFPGNASIKTVWQIDPSNVNASRNNVRFRYLDALKNSQNPANIFAYRYTSGAWNKISASLTSSRSGDIYATSLFGTPGFSPWTLSSDITPANPDLTPTVTVLNTTYNSPTQSKEVILNVNEVGGSATAGTITVRLLKSNRLSYTFDGSRTSSNVFGSEAVNNTDWEVVTDNASALTLRTKAGVVVNANSVSKIGLTIAKLSGDNSNATINQNFIVLQGSGGEINGTNNLIIVGFFIAL